MRRTTALIVGGGPAGAAAAIALGRGGARPMLIERHAEPQPIVCGGFLGWDAVAALDRLGVPVSGLGARPIDRLRLVTGGHSVEARLPYRAAGCSRRTLDAALLKAAREAGAEIRRGQTVRAAAPDGARLADGGIVPADALFLATGKHELRGRSRPLADWPRPLALGFRSEIPAGRAPADLDGKIELHLFDGGYCGLLVQEDGSVNVCFSVARARLADAGGVEALIAAIAGDAPALARRLQAADGDWAAIAGVPYGWRARETVPGLFRLGDQGAVIASLAGDGIAIALASAAGAARAYLDGGAAAAPAWQRGFAARARAPLYVAERLRRAAESPALRPALMLLAGHAPALARLAARLTRIG